MRHFIRHPTDIPIEVDSGEPAAQKPPRARNVSAGGLAIRSAGRLEPGRIVGVRISLLRPPFETNARVVWCVRRDEGYELGVEFLTLEDAFRARMVEQVCHIQTYKRKVLEAEGRALTDEDAAREWIDKHAADFPDVGVAQDPTSRPS
jgi:PilZ domain.